MLSDVRKFTLAENEAALAYLQQHGYVVYASTLSPGECEQALSLLWEYLEALGTGINRHDARTWGEVHWPHSVGGGILPWYGIGQSDALWFVRTRPAVRQAFEAIWRTDDLITSFDGCALFRPWQPPHGQREWRTNGGWWHVDQNPLLRPDFDCVQGLVNLLPTSEQTGGNVLLPGTHNSDFARLREDHPDAVAASCACGDYFLPIPSCDKLLQGDGPHALMARLAAGDMLLWDSRVIHCSAPGQPKDPAVDGGGVSLEPDVEGAPGHRKNSAAVEEEASCARATKVAKLHAATLATGAAAPAAETVTSEATPAAPALLRAITLVCMVPRSKASDEVLETRKQAVKQRQTTTHRRTFSPFHRARTLRPACAPLRGTPGYPVRAQASAIPGDAPL